MTLHGPFAELIAAVGAVAAGGAFIGTALALAVGRLTRLGQSEVIERVASTAAYVSVAVVAFALVEEILR